MSNSVVFHKLKNQSIFRQEFMNMQDDNRIVFGKGKFTNLAVLYAPNGTGKTSMVNVLNEKNSNSDCSFEVKYRKITYTNENNTLFYVIQDHRNRNIIKVKESDYIIGDNIQREYMLKEEIDKSLDELVNNVIYKGLKDYGYSAKSNLQFEVFNNQKLADMCKILIPASRKNFSCKELMEFILLLEKLDVPEHEEEKLLYLKDNYTDKNSILYRLLQLEGKSIATDRRIIVIGRNNEAIHLVNRYFDSEVCVVCDNVDYHPEEIITKKSSENKEILDNMDSTSRDVLEKIIQVIDENKDPFKVKKILLMFLQEGDSGQLENLIDEVKRYVRTNEAIVQNYLHDIFEKHNLKNKIEDYNSLNKEPPQITEEDLLFVKEFVKNAIGREINLVRDNDNIRLTIDNRNLYNSNFDDLHLSTGEQNFISLTFEFLKARNRSEEIVVLDDPISSFDSIYKNKIAFSIIKFLQAKNVIVLTHNTDLIRLLEHQLNNSFTLYLLNNFDGARNGFVSVNNKEKEILLGIDKFLDLLRNRHEIVINNKKLFLISLIPFMRGYANLIGDNATYRHLSKVMHGYEYSRINITKIYNKLFCKNGEGNGRIEDMYYVSVKDILQLNINDNFIVDNIKYPLLNKTLYHSVCYLFLRLKVDRCLTRQFKIRTKGRKLLLTNILNESLVDDKVFDEKEKMIIRLAKAKLASKKTLLNEFNHFEGNLSIFQPAIDISDDILNNEILEINEILVSVQNLKTIVC